MTDHPLTDETCHSFREKCVENWESGFSYENMRAATDWQLEQVLHWLRTIKWPLGEVPRTPSKLADQLAEAMRPQDDEL